jgi:hypothetical protein
MMKNISEMIYGIDEYMLQLSTAGKNYLLIRIFRKNNLENFLREGYFNSQTELTVLACYHRLVKILKGSSRYFRRNFATKEPSCHTQRIHDHYNNH